MNSNPFIISKENPTHKILLKRKASERRFNFIGKFAIYVSLAFLTFMLVTIFSNGTSAFFQTAIKIEIYFDSAKINADGAEITPEFLENINYRTLVFDSLKERFPEIEGRKNTFDLYGVVTKDAPQFVKEKLLQNPKLIGERASIWVPASSNIDMYYKGKIAIEGVAENLRKVSDVQVKVVDDLKRLKSIKKTFNTTFFTHGDSREAELSGILGSLLGSIFVIGICMLVALPLGVSAAIYLEEFAPKNYLTDIVEIGINNLAAVPSIVYGLLGLAVYINFFEFPRSSSLVGGLTLALLVLPTIVITTRNALASVPPSIKSAAIGLGASPMQVLFHHILPLSMPGIMTGAILSISRALGETAPLLMIGMVAFIKDLPAKITDPSSALPVQVYIWSDLPELGFVEKTSGAIIILLVFLALANGTAVYLRKKFEYKW
jgi:phosphate transport system permease protein